MADISRANPDNPALDVHFIEDRGYLNVPLFAPPADLPTQPARVQPVHLDYALLVEPPWAWSQSTATRLLMLLVRGDVLSDRVNAWTLDAVDSYRHVTTSDLFCVRGSIQGAYPASRPLIDDLEGLELLIVSPDKQILDSTFATAQAGQSLIFIGTKILWAWDPVLPVKL